MSRKVICFHYSFQLTNFFVQIYLRNFFPQSENFVIPSEKGIIKFSDYEKIAFPQFSANNLFSSRQYWTAKWGFSQSFIEHDFQKAHKQFLFEKKKLENIKHNYIQAKDGEIHWLKLGIFTLIYSKTIFHKFHRYGQKLFCAISSSLLCMTHLNF